MGRAAGLSDRDVVEISGYESSDAYDDLDRDVLRLATAMTVAPAEISDDLRSRLVQSLGRSGFAELAAAVAWENHRARLNRALGVRAAGFSDGAACALPVQQRE